MQFKWMNESRLSESKERLELYAPAHTDFFCSSESAGEEGITPGVALQCALLLHRDQRPILSSK